MAAYLSPEWIDALDTAIAADDDLRDATAGIALVVEYRVRPAGEDDPAPTVDTYQVVLDHGEASVRAGADRDADVWFTLDRPVAAAITRGDLSPLDAVIHGDLTIGGDPAALLANRELFASLDDVFAGVRDDTEF